MLTALIEWLTDPEQAELRRSLLLWLREGFLRSRLPQVSFPQLNDLDEALRYGRKALRHREGTEALRH